MNLVSANMFILTKLFSQTGHHPSEQALTRNNVCHCNYWSNSEQFHDACYINCYNVNIFPENGSKVVHVGNLHKNTVWQGWELVCNIMFCLSQQWIPTNSYTDLKELCTISKLKCERAEILTFENGLLSVHALPYVLVY